MRISLYIYVYIDMHIYMYIYNYICVWLYILHTHIPAGPGMDNDGKPGQAGRRPGRYIGMKYIYIERERYPY